MNDILNNENKRKDIDLKWNEKEQEHYLRYKENNNNQNDCQILFPSNKVD